jgi:hypothetical protein
MQASVPDAFIVVRSFHPWVIMKERAKRKAGAAARPKRKGIRKKAKPRAPRERAVFTLDPGVAPGITG